MPTLKEFVATAKSESSSSLRADSPCAKYSFCSQEQTFSTVQLQKTPKGTIESKKYVTLTNGVNPSFRVSASQIDLSCVHGETVKGFVTLNHTTLEDGVTIAWASIAPTAQAQEAFTTAKIALAKVQKITLAQPQAQPQTQVLTTDF